jgi:hypothetical protein
MATPKDKELDKELNIALNEIGPIKPWFDEDFQTWLFSSPLYPVECEGSSAKEVIKKYPKYLAVFIEHRIRGKIDATNEKKTKGKGGYRPGAGRPKGSTKEKTKQIRLPEGLATWLKQPDIMDQITILMHNQQIHNTRQTQHL